jgi:hypothetical protein
VAPLRHEAHPSLRDPFGRVADNGAPIEADVARGGSDHARNGQRRRRLARAIRSNETDDLSELDMKSQSADCWHFSVANLQALDRKQHQALPR